MKRLSRFRFALTGRALFLIISSASVLLCIGLGRADETDQQIAMLCPAVFWSALLLEVVFVCYATRLRRQLEKRFSGLEYPKGIRSIGKRADVLITDAVGLLAVAALVVLLLRHIPTSAIQYLLLFVIVLTVRLHLMLTGKNHVFGNYTRHHKAQLKPG